LINGGHMNFTFTPMLKNSLIMLLLLHFPSYAVWYQGSAKHNFNLLNFDQVRTATIKRAVANATMKDSSYIQVEDIVLNGLLKSSKTLLRSEGQLRRIEIIDESIDKDIFSVIVKVDIKSSMSCEKDPYTKSLLITQFPLLNPHQAKQGGLFNLGMQVSKRFDMQLNSQPKTFISLLHSESFMPSSANKKEHYLENVGKYLATKHDSQFILFGAIRDISLFEQVKDQLLFDDVLLRRNFTIELYLYDALRNKMLLQKNYHGEANWQYELNHIVDTNNSVFWRTNYGRNVLHTINSAVTDINETLGCQQSLSQIIHQENQKLVINIGENQGVKIGDKFELVHQRIVSGGNGKSLTLHSVDHLRTLNVVQLNAKHAILTNDGSGPPLDNQLLNLVIPKYIF